MSWFFHWVYATIVIGFAAFLLPGIMIDDARTAFLTSFVLGALNLTVRPLLFLLTIPVTIVTLGLFLVVINTAMVLLASDIVPGFHVQGFWWAFLFSCIVGVLEGTATNTHKKKTA